IFRSANTLFNNPTSNAPHMMYPLSFETVNKVVFGNRTVTAVNGCPLIIIGVNVTKRFSPFPSIHMDLGTRLCYRKPVRFTAILVVIEQRAAKGCDTNDRRKE